VVGSHDEPRKEERSNAPVPDLVPTSVVIVDLSVPPGFATDPSFPGGGRSRLGKGPRQDTVMNSGGKEVAMSSRRVSTVNEAAARQLADWLRKT
jgi:hypothetical protein